MAFVHGAFDVVDTGAVANAGQRHAASGQGVFSLTIDVERAYRVIEYVPGLSADVQA